MEAITVKELLAAVHGELLQGDETAQILGVNTDSRTVKSGEVFVPLVGERFDGHDYIEKAISAGAEGCLCARVPETLLPGKFYIKVPDTLLPLKDLAAWYRAQFSIPFVQVTGSVGKTTTKEMIASVLGVKFHTLKTAANYNNEIGTPQTLLGLSRAHQAAVIETGMDRAGQIRYLGEMVKPDIAVITNVGDMHIEYLGSRENILKAKCEIFENLAAMAAAIGEYLGETKEEIERGAAAYEPAGSRMHVITFSENRRLLDDCYNAGPQSMAASLRVLGASGGKKAAVIGDMAELGELTERAHKEIGELTKELGIGTVIAIGARAKYFTEGNPSAQWFGSVDEAMGAVKAAFTAETAMLVKASHSMHFEKIVEELTKA